MDYGRTEYDVGEIFRRYGLTYAKTHPMSMEQRKALHCISRCRTAMLGGHLEHCPSCGHEHPSYNSCGNRNCPKCQGIQQRRWVNERLKELLPVQYFHTVFTIPREYHILAKYSVVFVYGALFRASSKAVKRLMKKHYGAQPGLIAVIHSWGQRMQPHPHVHMIVTGGGLSADKSKWIHCPPLYLMDVVELQDEFKKQFAKEITKLHQNNKLRLNSDRKLSPSAEQIREINDKACAKMWNVNIQKPFAGPQKVIEYIGRYTHCVAIRNSRIKHIAEDGTISVDSKDYRDRDEKGIPKHKIVVFSHEEFIRSFMMHVIPKGFRKIRMYGIYAGNNRKEKIALCQSFFPADSTEPESDRDNDLPPRTSSVPNAK